MACYLVKYRDNFTILYLREVTCKDVDYIEADHDRACGKMSHENWELFDHLF